MKVFQYQEICDERTFKFGRKCIQYVIATAALWVRIQTFLKSTKWGYKHRVANTKKTMKKDNF
jgi:hypothetical protein